MARSWSGWNRSPMPNTAQVDRTPAPALFFRTSLLARHHPALSFRMPACLAPPSLAGKWLWPLVCAIACLACGSASGILGGSGGGGAWYQSLAKPPGTPPPWVFGPVWSVLYLLMGVFLGRLIVRRAGKATAFFGIQFLLNLAWTPVFFGLQQPGVALVVILLLLFFLILTIRISRKHDKPAALLLLPYLAWVAYATYLNAGFFILNR